VATHELPLISEMQRQRRGGAEGGAEGVSDQATPAEGRGHFLVYTTEDGGVKLEVRLEEESVWLMQQHMAALFQTTQQNISFHLKNIFEEGELALEATHKKTVSVRREGRREVSRALDFYNLDAIISVGYQVKSALATRFRIWATQRLREYIIMFFMVNSALAQAVPPSSCVHTLSPPRLKAPCSGLRGGLLLLTRCPPEWTRLHPRWPQDPLLFGQNGHEAIE